jgi:hypothetical protein
VMLGLKVIFLILYDKILGSEKRIIF